MTTKMRVKWLTEFNNGDGYPFKFVDNNKTQVFCQACECTFSAAQKTSFVRHHAGAKHVNNMKLKTKGTKRQAQLEDVMAGPSKKSKADMVGRELCGAFLAANIPLRKLDNSILRNFLETNIGITMPDQSTLRKKYMVEIYDEIMEEIRKEVDGKEVWISVDETTDLLGRAVANVLVGVLNSAEYHKPHLVRTAFLDRTDAGVIARLVNDTLRMLFPTFNDKLLKLLVTDGARYMTKAGRDLKVFFPELLHVTCIAHALHRLCETIRETFPNINTLISVVKKVFLKAPLRRTLYKDCCPGLKFPPEPVITR